MQKDLKIGLILGLILVIFIGLRLVTDPRLSTKARMEKIHEVESEGRSQDLFDNEASREKIPGETVDDAALTKPAANESQTITNGSSTDQIGKPSPPEQTTKEPTVETSTNDEKSIKESEVIKTQKFYIVQRGDTLSGISQKYYGTAAKWPKILEANQDVLKDPNKLQPGMKLIIPE